MGAYLIDHPPRQRQFRARGTTISGVVVLHTAESAPDTTGTDLGAEGVARFIQGRSDFGSYHWLADSDGPLLLVPMRDFQAYGEGTGTNPHAIHISAATQAHRWPSLPRPWVEATVRNMAKAAHQASDLLEEVHGVRIPARRVTAAQARNRVEGFVTHAEMDPSRRSDPGKGFPWDFFLKCYRELEAGKKPAPPKDDDKGPKPVAPWRVEAAKKAGIQNAELAARACRKAGLPFWVACALLEKESHGRNVFGHDSGGAGPHGQPVTKERFQDFYRKVLAGATSNGVGPCQITWAGSLQNGKRDGGYFNQMIRMGLDPWDPEENMVFGFALLRSHYNRLGDSWEKAGTAYNGSPDYGRDFLAKVKVWRDRLKIKGGLNPKLDGRPPVTLK